MRKVLRARAARVFTAALIAPVRRRCSQTSASVRLGGTSKTRLFFISNVLFIANVVINVLLFSQMSIEMIIPSLLTLALYPW